MDGDTPKLADFGLARPIITTDTSPDGRVCERVWGMTRQYAAPERFSRLPGPGTEQERINTQSDVFSFGLLLYFIWTSKVGSQQDI